MGAQMQHQQLMAQQAAVIQQQQLMLSQQGAHCQTPPHLHPASAHTRDQKPHSASKPWSPSPRPYPTYNPALNPETSSPRRTHEMT